MSVHEFPKMNRRSTDTSSSGNSGVTGGGGGGSMLDQRVANLEKDVAVITAGIQQLATKEDIGELKVVLSELKAVIPHLATNENATKISSAIPHLATKDQLSQVQTKLIIWTVSTIIATAGIALAIARLVH